LRWWHRQNFPPGRRAASTRTSHDILQAADMKNLLAQQGLVAEGGAPEALTAQVRSDTAKWREVIGRVGITAAE
jgi:tripartite-type tricarboxylate transporter receptor subunit TctC